MAAGDSDTLDRPPPQHSRGWLAVGALGQLGGWPAGAPTAHQPSRDRGRQRAGPAQRRGTQDQFISWFPVFYTKCSLVASVCVATVLVTRPPRPIRVLCCGRGRRRSVDGVMAPLPPPKKRWTKTPWDVRRRRVHDATTPAPTCCCRLECDALIMSEPSQVDAKDRRRMLQVMTRPYSNRQALRRRSVPVPAPAYRPCRVFPRTIRVHQRGSCVATPLPAGLESPKPVLLPSNPQISFLLSYFRLVLADPFFCHNITAFHRLLPLSWPITNLISIYSQAQFKIRSLSLLSVSIGFNPSIRIPRSPSYPPVRETSTKCQLPVELAWNEKHWTSVVADAAAAGLFSEFFSKWRPRVVYQSVAHRHRLERSEPGGWWSRRR